MLRGVERNFLCKRDQDYSLQKLSNNNRLKRYWSKQREHNDHPEAKHQLKEREAEDLLARSIKVVDSS